MNENQPETWTMLRSTLERAIAMLQIGRENTQELLILHDTNLGRTTRSNRRTAEMLENEITAMSEAIESLNQSYQS